MILAVVTASSASFAVEIAKAAIRGKSAVFVKSPANLIFPFVVVVASGAPEDTLEST